MKICWVSVMSVLVLVPALASAQSTAQDQIAPSDPAPPVEARVTVTTPEVAVPPALVVPPPPTSYAAPAPVAYVPPVRDPATRPSFGTSIALHVAAAITGPLGLAGLVFGSIWAILCSSGGGLDGCGVTSAAIVITGGVLETASVALGISATAVHGHTRARLREWEMGTARLLPWGGPSGGGATFALTF